MEEIYLLAIYYFIITFVLLSGVAIIYFKGGYHKPKQNKTTPKN